MTGNIPALTFLTNTLPIANHFVHAIDEDSASETKYQGYNRRIVILESVVQVGVERMTSRYVLVLDTLAGMEC
mgnify:CR=1 FL=1|jgi:hypothetical protein